MRELFLVAAGGAIGAGLRYTVGVAFVSRTGPGFPWHTFGINILGAFLLGLLMAASFASAPSGAAWRLFLAPGLLGGFTTFSTLSYESVALTQQGLVGAGLANMFGSAAAGLAAAALGVLAGRAL